MKVLVVFRAKKGVYLKLMTIGEKMLVENVNEKGRKRKEKPKSKG